MVNIVYINVPAGIMAEKWARKGVWLLVGRCYPVLEEMELVEEVKHLLMEWVYSLLLELTL